MSRDTAHSAFVDNHFVPNCGHFRTMDTLRRDPDQKSLKPPFPDVFVPPKRIIDFDTHNDKAQPGGLSCPL